MTIEIIRERDCQKCGQVRHVKLVRNITVNGTSQIYWLCMAHNGAAGHTITHDKVKAAGINIDELPVIENYSSQEQCIVCGAVGAELHHWAPKHLFGDTAEAYPKSYLCHHHHMLWHDLVTPDMN